MRRSALLAVLAIALCGCGSPSGAGPIDARAIVAQPRDVGGVRTVSGTWNTFSDEGVAPIADALGPHAALPANIAYQATYDGLVGADVKTQITSIAVVLPDTRTARRLLARTDSMEAFIGAADTGTSPTRPTDGADAMRTGEHPGSRAIAWTRGRLYGLIVASGPASADATRLARLQEQRFERALAGSGGPADPRFTTPAPPMSPVLPALAPVKPSPPAHRIDHAGRYTLADLGIGRQTFDPSAGVAGVSIPVVLDLPKTPTGRWLWRATIHVLVTLAPNASPGDAEVRPVVANISGPGAEIGIAQDLATGKVVMVEQTRHVATTRTFEVTERAMLGGTPSPRQDTSIGFAVVPATSRATFSRVTILPDSGVEVFADPAKIGRYAMSPARVVVHP